MSILGKDFEDAMKQLSNLINDTELVVLNLNNTIVKLNSILDRTFNTMNIGSRPLTEENKKK